MTSSVTGSVMIRDYAFIIAHCIVIIFSRNSQWHLSHLEIVIKAPVSHYYYSLLLIQIVMFKINKIHNKNFCKI